MGRRSFCENFLDGLPQVVQSFSISISSFNIISRMSEWILDLGVVLESVYQQGEFYINVDLQNSNYFRSSNDTCTCPSRLHLNPAPEGTIYEKVFISKTGADRYTPNPNTPQIRICRFEMVCQVIYIKTSKLGALIPQTRTSLRSEFGQSSQIHTRSEPAKGTTRPAFDV